MRPRLGKFWPVLKALFAIAILVAIGRQFASDLQRPELWRRSVRFDWLVLSGALYLLGLGFGAVYWYRLLHALGQKSRFLAAIRAHYIGQMGKYLPGKAWALFLRSSLVESAGVRIGVAVLTSFYEVLTTMAMGAFLAAVVFALQAQDTFSLPDWHAFRRLLPREALTTGAIDPKVLALLALALLLVIGILILPPVFNWLAHRITLPFRDRDAAPLPRIRLRFLFQGLVLTAGLWLLFGASLLAVLHGVMAQPPAWTLESWGRYTALGAVSYVASFVIVPLPAGLGAREFLLVVVLMPGISILEGLSVDEARITAVASVLLLRCAWTAGELVMVGILYWLPSGVRNQESGVRNQESAINEVTRARLG